MLLVSTTPEIPGFKTKECKGLVWASATVSRSIVSDAFAVAKGLSGGEIHSYKRLVNEAHAKAMEQLAENAKKQGANAVIAIRFDSVQVLPATINVSAYGTAVKVAKK